MGHRDIQKDVRGKIDLDDKKLQTGLHPGDTELSELLSNSSNHPSSQNAERSTMINRVPYNQKNKQSRMMIMNEK